MAVNISIQEVGGNVVWTATGTLNLGGLTYDSTQVGGSGFDAVNALFGSGLGASADVYSGAITKPGGFGTGGAGAASASGSYLSIQSVPAKLYVPAGYTSGAAISNTTTYTGSFTSLGLNVGTYVYSWGSGGNADTLTLSIGASPTPTPTVTQTQTPSSTPAPISNTVEISSNNYIGQIADITFYPCSGGTTSLGEHVLPYTYQSTYYYGQYSLYFSAYNSTCTYDIVCPSPTPTSTTTPTVTPTNTPTPTTAPSGGWFFYSPDNQPVPVGPTNNGDTTFISGTAPGIGTYNPNYTGGTFNLYFNNNNSVGTSYLSQFSGLNTTGGTITISQGSSTAIYSGTSSQYDMPGPGTFLQLTVTGSTQMIQSASTAFVSGTTINVVVS